nr:palindromic element RPE4 domain-containing protein [Rickettsia monacensis]
MLSCFLDTVVKPRYNTERIFRSMQQCQHCSKISPNSSQIFNNIRNSNYRTTNNYFK